MASENGRHAVGQPKVVFTQDYHQYKWPEHGIQIDLERFSEGRDGGVKAEVVAGESLTTGRFQLLHRNTVNLISGRSRKEFAGECSLRFPFDKFGFDWPAAVEVVSFQSAERWRQGEPSIDLVTYKPDRTNRWVLEPYLEPDGNCILYAAGETGKSTIALGMALSVATCQAIVGLPHVEECPVMYLDWETGPDAHKERLDAICLGHNLTLPPGRVIYRRMYASLPEAAPELRKEIVKKGIGLVIVDSLGAARGDDPKEASYTIKLFNAARGLGVPWVGIDHLSKAELANEGNGGKPTPYGSIYTVNMSRVMYVATRVEARQENQGYVLMTATKANNFRKPPRHAYRMHYEQEGEWLKSLGFEHVNPNDVQELFDKLSATEKILLTLRQHGALSVEELASETGIEEKQAVSSRLNELKRQGKVISLPGRKWGERHHG